MNRHRETEEIMSNNTETDGRPAGRTAVITGGAAGMGRAAALAFANEGTNVAILDIQRDAGEESASSASGRRS